MVSGTSADAGDGQRLAVVEPFERCELFRVLLDQIRQLPAEPSPLARTHSRPRAFIECLARRPHGFVDVGRVGFRDVR